MNQNMRMIGLAVVAVAVVGVGYMALKPETTQEDTTGPAMERMEEKAMAPAPNASDAAMIDSTSMMAEAFKAGSYTVVGAYTSPAGAEEVEVTLEIDEAGVVMASDVTVLAENPISKKMQEDFKANYKTEVIGKNITELNLGKVSGSSLTPKGFNDAVDAIEQQAAS